MSSVLLGWDPVWPEAWQPDYSAAVAGTRDAGIFRTVWDISGSPGVLPGSDAWFVLPGEGIAGHGVIVSYPYRLADDEEDTFFTVVDLDIDLLLPLGEQVPLDDLVPELAELAGDGDVGDVTVLDDHAGETLRAAWAGHVIDGPGSRLSPVPGTLPQQALRWSLASRYENDPDAARICLVHHGPACSACGFDFMAAFGALGTGVMQVHHIVPPELIRDGYELDPVTDLAPLCPNCHAMAHAGTPNPYSPAELRRLLEAQGSTVPPPGVQGAVLSPEALAAQLDAARLLRTQTHRPD